MLSPPQISRSSLIIGAVLVLLIPGALAAQAQPPTSRQLQQIGPAATSWPTKQKRWALVIGVDQYADTQITTLGGAANDARTLADALVRYAAFPQDQVFLLSSDQPAERQPTRGNILRRLSNMRSVIPPDGLLVISFAGHGIERDGRAFLLPSDAQVANDVDLLEQTAINVTQIKDLIRKTGVGQVVLILDACRNNPFARSFRSSVKGLAQMDAPTGTLISFATAPSGMTRCWTKSRRQNGPSGAGTSKSRSNRDWRTAFRRPIRST